LRLLRGFAILPAAMTLPPIITEDDALVALDKPAGLPVAPDRGERAAETLMDLVQQRLGRNVAGVHRLDAEASGVVLCAKTKPAIDFLSGEFQAKKVAKRFFALVVVLAAERAMKVAAPLRSAQGGLPGVFTVDLALGDDEEQPGRMRIFKRHGGRPSATDFRVVESYGRFVLVEGNTFTNSRHQLRVHLAAAGAPVLNDSFYGDPEEKLLLSGLKRRYKGRDEERPLIGRLALHAAGLTFTHPVTRLPVTVTAPLPHDFEVALKYLRKFAPK
jgi:23S rRNA-/tRNA-specific pseudouridylate synthase